MKRSILILCLLAALAVVYIKHSKTTTATSEPQLTIISASNEIAGKPVAMDPASFRQIVGTNKSEALFVLTNGEQGTCITVNSENIVTSRDKNGAVIWSTNITRLVKPSTAFSVKSTGDNIEIYPLGWERITISINKQNGKVFFTVY